MPKIQIRRDTSANWKSVNPTLLAGEWALETDTKKMKIGDGTPAYNSLPYSTAEDRDEWIKPDDWVDIRSGALENSIYLLVAHSVPTESEGVYTVAEYPKFIMSAQVSTSANTYDVYVDGVKAATGTSGATTATTLDWGALYTAGTVRTIHTTTHPSSLVYHVVRITPTVSTDTLTQFRNYLVAADDAYKQQGILWAHFELSNAIKITDAFGGEIRPRNLLLEAVTAKNDKIIYTVSSSANQSGFYSSFAYCSSLRTIPVLQAESQTYLAGGYLAFKETLLSKVTIKNNNGNESINLINGSNIKELDIENGVALSSGTGTLNNASNARLLKKFPKISGQKTDTTTVMVNRLDSLEPTVIDDTHYDTRTRFLFRGASGYITNLVGLTVSNSAPFNNATSPQIDITYTNMNRAALVTLFNSLPTVTDSQVINITGATGAADLDATDLAIATGKGWTVTR